MQIEHLDAIKKYVENNKNLSKEEAIAFLKSAGIYDEDGNLKEYYRPIVEQEKPISLKLGKYEHYKGKQYQVLYIATHSETLEQMVIYKALYGDYEIWVRPLKMFFEVVNGKPRFKFIDE